MIQGNGKMSMPVSIAFSGNAGLTCGEWLSFGAPDLPGDQRVASQFQVLKIFIIQIAYYLLCRLVGTQTHKRLI